MVFGKKINISSCSSIGGIGIENDNFKRRDSLASRNSHFSYNSVCQSGRLHIFNDNSNIHHKNSIAKIILKKEDASGSNNSIIDKDN